jgi:hypothetical protein
MGERVLTAKLTAKFVNAGLAIGHLATCQHDHPCRHSRLCAADTGEVAFQAGIVSDADEEQISVSVDTGQLKTSVPASIELAGN